MSALKKIAGLVVGVSAVGAIGVAVAQGVPPNPHITNPALGAGEQSSYGTLIGETGQLPMTDMYVQRTASITKEAEPVAAAPAPAQEPQPVAQTTTESTTVAQAPADNSSNTQAMGAGPAPEAAPAERAPRHDRG